MTDKLNILLTNLRDIIAKNNPKIDLEEVSKLVTPLITEYLKDTNRPNEIYRLITTGKSIYLDLDDNHKLN